jgi:hypothetical protein
VDTPPPPPEKTVESLEETIKSTTSSAAPPKGGEDTLSSLSVPSDVQETIQKPFSSMNQVLKSTQDSIKEAQRQAAEQSSSISSTSVGGSSSTSGPPEKVPTLGEFFLKSLSSQKDALGETVSKKATTSTSVDIKLPSINGIQPPEFKLPETGVVSLKTDVTLPEAGKALPFTDYIKAKAVGALPNDPTSVGSTFADAKIKFGVMVANFYKLIGKDVPDSIQMPGMQDFTGISNRVATFDLKGFVDNLPESTPWTAVAVGTLLVVIGARKGDTSSVATKESTEKTVAAASKALGGLTSDLVSKTISLWSLLGIPITSHTSKPLFVLLCVRKCFRAV